MTKYKYSEQSLLVFNTLHEDLQTLFSYLLDFRDHALIEGHRSEARQNELFFLKRTKVKFPHSRHNSSPSMAVDVLPWPFEEKEWEDRDKWHYFAGYVKGVADQLFELGLVDHKLRWGGDWDKDFETSDNEFDDFPHFELYLPKEG